MDKLIKEFINLRCEGYSAIEIAQRYNITGRSVADAIKYNKERFGIIIPDNLPIKRYMTKERKEEIKQDTILKMGKKIIVSSIDGSYSEIFNSKREAGRILGLQTKSINCVLKGEQKQHKGYFIKAA